jgi:hypothetical protein
VTLLGAAVVPAAPLLVPALAGGSALQDASLRTAACEAVDALLAEDGRVVVVGAAARTGPQEGTWDWSGFGVAARGGKGPALPLALAVGAWLLDVVAPTRPRAFLGVAQDSDASACRELGADLARQDVLLLVVGDGSARRSEKAPGHLDPRAEPFDRAATHALRAGDPDALLALPAGLGRELLAAGRAPWQVLAGATQTVRVNAAVTYADAPYGVGYLVAHWAVPR